MTGLDILLDPEDLSMQERGMDVITMPSFVVSNTVAPYLPIVFLLGQYFKRMLER